MAQRRGGGVCIPAGAPPRLTAPHSAAPRQRQRDGTSAQASTPRRCPAADPQQTSSIMPAACPASACRLAGRQPRDQPARLRRGQPTLRAPRKRQPQSRTAEALYTLRIAQLSQSFIPQCLHAVPGVVLAAPPRSTPSACAVMVSWPRLHASVRKHSQAESLHVDCREICGRSRQSRSAAVPRGDLAAAEGGVQGSARARPRAAGRGAQPARARPRVPRLYLVSATAASAFAPNEIHMTCRRLPQA